MAKDSKDGNGIFSGIFGEKKEELPPGDNALQPEAAENNQTADAKQKESVAAKVAELENSVNVLKDQLIRKAADFENFKKRNEADTLSRIIFANERLLGDLIPVIDDFERSLKMSKGQNDANALRNGIELIYGKLMKVLDAHGLKPYDSLGKPFNTDFHDALMQMPKKDVPPHTVIEEVEKGYMLNDRILRHAKVVVSAEAETEVPGTGGEGSSSPEVGQA